MNKRFALIFASILAATTSFAQLDDEALAVKVTFTQSMTSVGRALEGLSNASKVPLLASVPMAGEPLMISVTDAKLADLMAQIAKVTGGAWRREEGGFRLIRPAGMDAAEQNAERAERLKSIRTQIAKKMESLKPKPAGSKQTSEGPNFSMGFGGMGGSGAGDKAITKLLGQIDVNAIAGIEQGERVVFSSLPTRMQRPFFGNVAPVVTELVQNHNAATANRPPTNVGADDEVDEAELNEFLKAIGISRNDKPIEGRPAKVLLAVAKGGGFMGMMGGYQIELLLFDSNGKVLIREQSMLMDSNGLLGGIAQAMGAAMEGIGDALGGATGEKPKEQEIEGPDGDIVYSKETKEVATLFGTAGGGMSGGMSIPSKLTPDLEAKLLRPDIYDPLSFVESESLAAVASVKKWNVVANLPDSRISMFGMMAGETATKVNKYLTSIFKDKRLVANSANGWLTIQPSHPRSARLSRVDRASLAKLIGGAKTNIVVNLDDYAAYALKNPPPMETPAAMIYLMLFAPNAMSQGMMGMTDWDMLRFYGTLNPVTKSSLPNGITMSLTNVEPYQRKLVERMLFGANANLVVGAQPEESAASPFMAIMKSFMGNNGGTWKQEPTEIMPDGLPNAGTIQIKAENTMVGRVEGESELNSMFGALGPGELALFQFMKDDPNMGMMAQGMPPITALKMGTRSTYKFRFNVAADVSTSRVLNDDRISKDGQILSIDNLPADFRAQIEKQKELLKKDPFFKMMMGMGTRGREVPPPL